MVPWITTEAPVEWKETGQEQSPMAEDSSSEPSLQQSKVMV